MQITPEQIERIRAKVRELDELLREAGAPGYDWHGGPESHLYWAWYALSMSDIGVKYHLDSLVDELAEREEDDE